MIKKWDRTYCLCLVLEGSIFFLVFLPLLGWEALEGKLLGKNNFVEEMDNYFQRWLKQDVVYIISQEEKEVFQVLQTYREKEEFIEEFWRRRDDDQLTVFNQFKEEHYRRLAYANEHFQSGLPGWKTDRGRIYIIYGEPAEVVKNRSRNHYRRSVQGSRNVSPGYVFEIWRYKYIEGIGPDVEVEFVDSSGSGEYHLARVPLERNSLLLNSRDHRTVIGEAELLNLKNRSSLSPWHLDQYPKTHRETPFHRYHEFSRKQRTLDIKSKDLQDLMGVGISRQKLPFRSRHDYFRLNKTAVMVPLTLEIDNQNITFKAKQGDMAARLSVYGIVTSLNNSVIAEFEQDLDISFSSEDLNENLQSNSQYQKVLILKSNNRYKAEVIIKDFYSGHVGFLQIPITVPTASEELELSSLVLTNFIAQLREIPSPEEMLVIGDLKVRPNLSNRFYSGEAFGAYLQVYNASFDMTTTAPKVSVSYWIDREGKQVKYWSDEVGQSIYYYSQQRLVLVKSLPLTGLPPAFYELHVEIKDQLNGKSAQTNQEFEIVEGG